MATESGSTGEGDGAERQLEQATFAGGCFWCVEAVFERIEGVVDVVSGYTGGNLKDPTYKQVTTGETGHAESIQITFDPEVISFERLLDWFWAAHDPTTLNRQGADVGTHYRSAVFYHNDEQKAIAEASKKAAQEDFADPIVTEITELDVFYEAEEYHQDYFELNPAAGYCRAVIAPKLRKLDLE